ncbi:MAG: hypothetical protein JWP35_586 [Caulobacter sp.]|nr:hypothetical protein [Caulobacter sp.]
MPQDVINHIPVLIAAVGALGIAAFGVVEALGKSLFVFDLPGGKKAGLPYVGFAKIDPLLKLVDPAMRASYGDAYRDILLQQYRAGRGKGQAPETIRQGVRLGLPFLDMEAATRVIANLWGLPPEAAAQLAAALTNRQPPRPSSRAAAPDDPSQAQALAARFATALDTRVQAAFDIADAVYQTRAQLWAAVIAIGLSLGYQAATNDWTAVPSLKTLGDWSVALLVGLVAVPLAPVAKDLSSSLSDALDALGKLRGGGK